MSNTHQRRPRLKPLLDKVPPGFIVETRWLTDLGVDPKSLHNYVANGWLERVMRGVYRRPLTENVVDSAKDSWEVPLLSLQWIMNYRLYLGGENSLDLHGFRHYLRLGDNLRVHVYGDAPSWLTRLPIPAEFDVHQRTLLGDDPIGIGEVSDDGPKFAPVTNVWRWPIKASLPERAILEMLDRIPNHASFDHVDKIFETLTTLRPKLLMELLSACQSIKVRRLFFVFADRHKHAWCKELNSSLIDFGSGPRALVNGGKIHPIYRISVPKEFLPTTDEKEFPDSRPVD